MAQTYTRPDFRLTPTPEGDDVVFWTGGEDDRLMIHRCRSCEQYFHPPAPACFRCRSRDVASEPVSGRGRVATFTVNRQPWLPTLPPPYVIVLVELEEQPDVRIFSQLVDVDPAEVRIGDEVEVFFEHWAPEGGTEVWLPLFRPVPPSVDAATVSGEDA
ncbi:Zn-ribbon domain-containing OB-fold protein [Nocardioides sp. SOB44]|uniref:Zn-ribbon domain-containing OB-fold protein n=1 Tax=Nocardioides cremeus TaxID=3058044 RepID=A0ABT8TSS5_9ACTN|nr:Zn-ribbon domain-containing OB-fold protein [Nocardioides cremeus]MDO3395387.1 Zn-ribbon domain-containing OB-fold protein [Nocardioides cremeus]